MVTFFLVKFYTWQQLLCSLPFLAILSIAFYSFVIDTIVLLAFICLIIYYEHLRVDKINQSIKMAFCDKDQTRIEQLVKQFTEEQNRYCTHIWTFNHWTKRLYIWSFVTSIPFNLLIMHQILFESLQLNVRICGLSILLVDNMAIIGLQYIFALLSKKIHLMSSKLSRLQWSLKGIPFRIRIKLKLLMCLERLSAKDKIGVTLSSKTMTFSLLSLVS